MSEELPPPLDDDERYGVDTSVPNAARVYDYLLGGSTNFQVDRDTAERNNADLPGGIATARAEVRANRDFLGRVVRHLAADGGIRQFLDIGTGIPNDDNVHRVAQDTAPDSRIVCVDNDPVVLAHSHRLMRSTPEGEAAFIHGDIRSPAEILSRAEATLDFSRPVAVLLLGLLYLIADDEDPYGAVEQLMEPFPSGSCLVISHMTGDFHPEMIELAERLNESMPEPFVLRDREQVARFLTGLELVEPGIVAVDEWHPSSTTVAAEVERVSAYYAAVGRRP